MFRVFLGDTVERYRYSAKGSWNTVSWIPNTRYQTFQEIKVKEGIWFLLRQCLLQRLHRMIVLTVSLSLLSLFSPLVLYLSLGIHLLHAGFTLSYWCSDSFVISISHSLVKYYEKQWLVKHLPHVCDYGASTHQGTWMTVLDVKEWLTFPWYLCSPLLLHRYRDLSEITLGRLIKPIQIIQTTKSLVSENYLRWVIVL